MSIPIVPNEIILYISKFLNYYDLKILQKSDIYLDQLLQDEIILKAPNTIILFMLNTRVKKNRLSIKMNKRYNNLNSLELALYYFFFYENQYVENWLKGVNCTWKQNIINSYQFTIPEKVNKYNLFYIQKKMKPDEICNIGW